MEKENSVYILVDPFASAVFYVGISDKPIERYIQHIKCGDDGNLPKNKRIQRIIQQGALPAMYIIAEKLSREKALIFEAYSIELYRTMGHPLTNQSLRMGYRYTDEQQKLLDDMREFRRGRWLDRVLSKLFGTGGPYIYWFPPKAQEVQV